MITEIVQVQTTPSTTDEQIMTAADNLINTFMKNQDGYIDAEIAKAVKDNTWVFIYHFASMQHMQAFGEEMRKIREFQALMALTDPDHINVSFYEMMKKW